MITNTKNSSTPSKSPEPANDGYRVPWSGAKADGASGSHSTSSNHNMELHRQHIAECAYFMAEQRNFSGGDPIQDWLSAEQTVCCPTR
jgi:hypothetical protein